MINYSKVLNKDLSTAIESDEFKLLVFKEVHNKYRYLCIKLLINKVFINLFYFAEKMFQTTVQTEKKVT